MGQAEQEPERSDIDPKVQNLTRLSKIAVIFREKMMVTHSISPTQGKDTAYWAYGQYRDDFYTKVIKTAKTVRDCMLFILGDVLLMYSNTVSCGGAAKAV